MTTDGFATAWRALAPAWRRSLDLAWASLVSGGLAVGAVLSDGDGRIVAEGRNRAYDPSGGDDVLQRTPLAHAELNVLAVVDTDRSLGECVLWSTQEPCSMCAAACAFTGVGEVRYLAPDPWALSVDAAGAVDKPSLRVIGPGEDRWLIAANALFLLSIGLPRGGNHPTLERNRELEPETASIVDDLLTGGVGESRTLGSSVDDLLGGIWPALEAGAARRLDRVRR